MMKEEEQEDQRRVDVDVLDRGKKRKKIKKRREGIEKLSE